MSFATVTHATTTIEGVGAPPTSVEVDRYYGFQTWASDTDGRGVTYSIKNKPSWATFDTTYGHLYGVPPTSAAGTYANIVISASDGISQASLQPFSIVVEGTGSSGGTSGGGTTGGGGTTTPPSGATGTATVSWQPPTANTNGTAISNLAGFTVYYGTSQSSYKSVKVANPGLTSYTIDNLSAGTYYFTVAAYNTAGMASASGPIASKTIK
jgi:putative Ig domain-containing protein/fibronectin type III domain protein